MRLVQRAGATDMGDRDVPGLRLRGWLPCHWGSGSHQMTCYGDAMSRASHVSIAGLSGPYLEGVNDGATQALVGKIASIVQSRERL